MNEELNPAEAGTYEMKDGKRVLKVPATVDHPEGNRPRDENHKPLDLAEEQPVAAKRGRAATSQAGTTEEVKQ